MNEPLSKLVAFFNLVKVLHIFFGYTIQRYFPMVHINVFFMSSFCLLLILFHGINLARRAEFLLIFLFK